MKGLVTRISIENAFSTIASMLRNLVQCKLSAKLLIIQDTEKESAQDLFVAFLKNHVSNDSVKTCYLICFENPPGFYLQHDSSEKIIEYNFSVDPRGWNNKLLFQSDLSFFTSICKSVSEAIFFIDSLSFFVEYHGFYPVYRTLHYLKKAAKKVICLAHSDLFSLLQLEELKLLSSCIVKCEEAVNNEEKLFDVLYKKLGGKIITQQEIAFISVDFNVISKIKNKNEVLRKIPDVKDVMENLTTFKLGLEMSETERTAKNKLILPYLRNEEKTGGAGEIIYHPEAEDDLENDPDDDLDI